MAHTFIYHQTLVRRPISFLRVRGRSCKNDNFRRIFASAAASAMKYRLRRPRSLARRGGGLRRPGSHIMRYDVRWFLGISELEEQEQHEEANKRGGGGALLAHSDVVVPESCFYSVLCV